MTRLDAASQHPLLPTFALIAVVYLTCLGGVLAARLAWRGRTAYWLAVLGVFCFLVGALWGRGYISGGATFTFVSAGIVLAVFGVALDLIFGPPFSQAGAE
ncbi:MAG: hypothetical protein E6J25_07060 [Chloroflexi bacterium]|nr:MAG: hypothetical protein E6J25_07060 [Chloroflexota bacterium]TME57380.1 MAG: hypothetical protein E6I60_01855 [Chloroflexota bacterium]